MTIEDILEETGGFGRFQLLVVLCVCLNNFPLGWSMLQMTYSGFVSDWFCLTTYDSESENRSLQTCFIHNESNPSGPGDVACSLYEFNDSPLTIVTQWQLVCDKGRLAAAITSIQMTGVLLGVVLTDRLSELMGRKKTMYLFVVEHAVMNIVAAFSVSWQMFTACRFFIGLGIGVLTVCSFPHSLEFLPLKWRPMVSALPMWTIGVAVLALASWLMENWSHVHIACGILSLPGLLGYFFVPESLRWLTVHDQIKEAQEVVSKIAVVNRKLELRKASIMLQTVAWEEQKARENNQRYTFLAIFREKQMIKHTLVFSFHWFSLSLVYYGISFSVWNLAGNIYLNIFLLAVVELPAIFLTFFDNKIRRKLSSMIALAVACLAVFACLIVQYIGPDQSKARIITGLCLTVKLGAGAAWRVIQSWGPELYPPMTSEHGLMAANIAARIGAVVAPFVVDLDRMATASFIVMGCLLAVDIVLCIVTTETRGCKSAATASLRVVQVHDEPAQKVDLGHADGPGSESSTDTGGGCQSREAARVVGVTTLATIDEDTPTNETDPRAVLDTSTENNMPVAAKKNVAFSMEPTVHEMQSVEVEAVTKDHISMKNSKTNDKPAKTKKPRHSRRKTRRQKLEKNIDVGQAQSQPGQDSSPPYIETEYHKNIRYSIY